MTNYFNYQCLMTTGSIANALHSQFSALEMNELERMTG
jgi:hypothetical protein